MKHKKPRLTLETLKKDFDGLHKKTRRAMLQFAKIADDHADHIKVLQAGVLQIQNSLKDLNNRLDQAGIGYKSKSEVKNG